VFREQHINYTREHLVSFWSSSMWDLQLLHSLNPTGLRFPLSSTAQSKLILDMPYGVVLYYLFASPLDQEKGFPCFASARKAKFGVPCAYRKKISGFTAYKAVAGGQGGER
jgi:hypothetical protein